MRYIFSQSQEFKYRVKEDDKVLNLLIMNLRSSSNIWACKYTIKIMHEC